MRENKRALGNRYEEKAAVWLEKQGLKILRRNYQGKCGEIDIIAEEGDYLIFVEVKYRSTKKSGDALCAVNLAKQRRISRTAKQYLSIYRKSVDVLCRFDVVGIDKDKIQWIKNAFEYCD